MANIVFTKQFEDHHIYKEDEIINLIKFADNNDLNLITTEKDIVKIPKKYHFKINCLKIKIEFDKHDLISLKLLLKKKLSRKNIFELTLIQPFHQIIELHQFLGHWCR